ncbi:MerR family transcriptional regulator [Actinomadura sp. NTSP31]|uniref:MerR family transcriptional regulator n=1 Tax=Actinomadura sp. NTSP31 TaxID=1735447 RepID=UPI0035C07B0E
MRIGDAAAAAGTTPRALRFYEKRGLLPPPSRTAGGQREYGPEEVNRVRIIRQLLALGLTIEDVRQSADRLQLLEGDTLPDYAGPGCARTAGVALRRLQSLDAEISRLTRLREDLAASLGAPPRAESVHEAPGRRRSGDSRAPLSADQADGPADADGAVPSDGGAAPTVLVTDEPEGREVGFSVHVEQLGGVLRHRPRADAGR